LALHLRNHYGIDSRFIIRDLDGEPPQVLKHRFAVHLLPPVSEWEPLATRIVQRVSPRVVVVDMLSGGGKFLKMLRSEALDLKTITMDDRGEGLKYAMFSINAILETSEATFCGPDYAIISSSSECPLVPRAKVEEVLLCFGGYDHNGLTVKALKSIVGMGKCLNVTALIGSAFHNENELLDLAASGKIGRFDIIKETSNIGFFLKRADIGIVSGGLTLFEAMHCGLPTMALCQYEHQVATSARYQKEGAVVNLGLGTRIDRSRIGGELESLIDDYPRRAALSKRAAELVDGKGLQRVAEIINAITKDNMIPAEVNIPRTKTIKVCSSI